MQPGDFDAEMHADFRIAENLWTVCKRQKGTGRGLIMVTLYLSFISLDYIQSPRNLLLNRTKERIAVAATTVFILETIFMPYNDTIMLVSSLEVAGTNTDDHKWYGLGLEVIHILMSIDRQSDYRLCCRSTDLL